MFTAAFLKEHYPSRLTERYGIEPVPDDNIELLEAIGRRRGCLVSGGFIDFDKVSELILRELRSGKLGPITLEEPTDT